jgi:hypothetical protein
LSEEDSDYKKQKLEQGRQSREALKASAVAMEQRNKFEIFTHPEIHANFTAFKHYSRAYLQ